MSEVRCPMCSKPNPEEAEVCEFCGARIKPLFIGSTPDEGGVEERPAVPPSEDHPADQDQQTDWLTRMRGGMESDEEGQTDGLGQDESVYERGSTDLLGRFKGLGLAEEEETPQEETIETPSEELKDVSTSEPEYERGSTDLLGRFRGLGLAPDEKPQDEHIEEETADEEIPQEPDESLAERGSNDLVGRLSDVGLSEAEDEVTEESSSGIAEEAGESTWDSQTETEFPEDIIQETIAEPEPTEGDFDPSEDFKIDEAESGVPDWLARIRERRSEETESSEEPEKDIDWLSGLQEQSQPSEIAESVKDDDVEATSPFIDYDAVPEAAKQESPQVSDAFVGEPDFLSDLLDEESGEPGSLDELFKDLEEQVQAVEKIATEDDSFPGLDDEPASRTELDDLFADVDEDALLEEVPTPDEDFPFEPMEIEKGTSPLQDLFEELDRELQTGELPSLEPEAVSGTETDEDVDAALKKLLEEFDAEAIADSSLFGEEPTSEDEVKVDREIPFEEIFSDFQVSQTEAQELSIDDLDEVTIEESAASIEDVFGEVEMPRDEDAEKLEGVFKGGEALTDEEELSFEAAFDDVEAPSDDEISALESILADVDESTDSEDLSIEGAFSDVEAPTEEDISAIEKLFGEVEAASIEEEGSELDRDIFAELGVGVPEEEGISDIPSAFDTALEGEIKGDEAEIDFEFEPAEIEPESLAPGSDQLAAVRGFEEDDDGAEPLTTSQIISEEEPVAPLEEVVSDYTPSWLREGVSEEEISAERDTDLPHVPALIMDEEEVEAEEFGEDFLAAEVSMDDMPTWLQDLGADIDEDEIDEEETEIELAKAKLPPWLEAMRPIETFRADPDYEEVEEEEITEAAGPLAGLRGVLLAEPVVAMPRSASTGVAALDITERHYTNTEILRQMISEEELELARPEVRPVPVPILRWIISLLLVLAVAVPTLLGFPTFTEPTLAPQELAPFIELMNSIALDRPALLVFDYEPGFSPEMDAVAGAMIENLIGRRQPIVSISTRPTGPLLADRMILRIGSDRNLVNGVDYLHLGYLPGGSPAVQLFASSPRSSIVDGFRPPEEPDNVSIWNTPILSDVQTIKDFSVIAVIASGAETARNWIEQVDPYLEETPLVMVMSAGAEPMIRPYYESETPQIQGILTGLRSAIKYEVWNGTLSDATQNWNAFGTAILIAELTLIAGAMYGAGRWFLQRRMSNEE